jgi:hypothetical protein
MCNPGLLRLLLIAVFNILYEDVKNDDGQNEY